MKHRNDKWIRMARYLAGEMNTKEEIAYRNHFDGDPAKKKELFDMERSWKYFHDAHPERNRDSLKAWNTLYGRLEEDGLLEGQSIIDRKSRVVPFLKMAASVLIILAIGIPVAYFGFVKSGGEEGMESHFSEKGVHTVDLPDGSRVFLNEGSRITYPSIFEGERSLRLEGEAFFEVMTDPMNPFTVSSSKVVVSVLGTSFNMREKGESGDVEVFVENGKVKMAFQRTGHFITLETGDLGYARSSGLSRSVQKDPNYISWKTKNFKFVDTELSEVLLQLEESYHVEIHSGTIELEQMRITTTYREQSIDAILETIGTAFGLTVSRKQDHYYLTK